MTQTEFNKRFYRDRKGKTSEAARLVLVKGWKQSEACKETGADKGSLYHFIKKISK